MKRTSTKKGSTRKKRRSKSGKNRTKWIIAAIVALLIVVAGGIIYQRKTLAFRINEPVYVYIDNRKDYADLLEQLQSTAHLRSQTTFTTWANFLKYPQNIKPGKYELTPGMNYLQAIRLLRSGQQTPVRLTFNNIRLKKELAARIGNQLMVDPEVLLERLNDPAIAEYYDLDENTILTLFIPNTYEIYWNTTADRLLERMKKEYDRFWNKERLAKAHSLHLTPAEVTILASIVEEETNARKEYPIVAGLYLNRLQKGIRLQADPTVKFAVGDVTLKRIRNEHLQVESPYNTYKNAGLPPGPIRLPSIQGIDAVLNYAHHNYLYMCAKEDFSGTHNFAVTLAEHNSNAQKYRKALNERGIR